MSDNNDITRGTANRGVTDRGVAEVAQRSAGQPTAAERGLALAATRTAIAAAHVNAATQLAIPPARSGRVVVLAAKPLLNILDHDTADEFVRSFYPQIKPEDYMRFERSTDIVANLHEAANRGPINILVVLSEGDAIRPYVTIAGTARDNLDPHRISELLGKNKPQIGSIVFEGCAIGKNFKLLRDFAIALGAKSATGWTFYHNFNVIPLDTRKSTRADLQKAYDKRKDFYLPNQPTIDEMLNQRGVYHIWAEFFHRESSPLKLKKSVGYYSRAQASDWLTNLEHVYQDQEEFDRLDKESGRRQMFFRVTVLAE